MHTGEKVFAVAILLKVYKSFLFRQSKKNVVQPAITCLKLTIETLEQGHNRNTRTPCSCISVVNFAQVNAGWEYTLICMSLLWISRKE